MAELLQGRPTITTEWMVSVGLDLLTTVSLVTVVHEFEGLGTWLLEASSALPAQLRHELDLALRLTAYPHAVVETLAAEVLGPERLGHTDVEVLLTDLAALDATTCRRVVETIIAKSFARHNVEIAVSPTELLADVEALETMLKQLPLPVSSAEAAHLLAAPVAWHDLTVSSVRQFWERVYGEQWAETYPLLVRSIEYQRRQNYPSDFSALFATVTGRQVPDRVRTHLAEIEHVRFVPSLYIGPYVSFVFHASTATIFYNGQGTPTTDTGSGPQIDDLYHPLTALADKTRLTIMAMLNGRELYAQEIVERLGISQSAVSRHLQLMVDMKVLNVRRGDRGAKFYSINTTALQRAAKRLSEFR